MKINGVGDQGRAYPLDKAESSRKTTDPGATSQVTTGDRFELSPAARKIAALVQAANGLPEIRDEKVAELTRAIRSGVHQVEPRALAGSILEFEDALR